MSECEVNCCGDKRSVQECVCVHVFVCVGTRAAAEATPRIREREGGKENLKNRKPVFPPQRKKKSTLKKDSRRANAEDSEPGRGSLDNTHNYKYRFIFFLLHL